MKKISLLQLSLLSTGGMLGCGWLFSPYYGYQTAGIGVVLSWLITALITFIIGLSFAEICSMLPIVGGISRYMGITHNRTTAFIFLTLGWLSYTVYLPLESQSVVQYLGFWFPGLVIKVNGQIELSHQGIGLAMLIILSLTWFNTLIITKVTKANSIISIWKISIPLIVALIIIIGFGSWHNVMQPQNFTKFTAENVFLAITSSGLAFAFSGFQNGLILANQASNPKKSLPYSLFLPIIIGLIIYMSLSLSFLTGLNSNQQKLMNAVAPLLGLISLLGLNILFTLLFIDAVLAPLGTTNVYIAVTSRILLGLSKDFFPKSWLIKLNKNEAPISCLWLNAIIGIIFLFPFPTWKQLVSFLSSIIVFAYLAGPVSLLVLRAKEPELIRGFLVKQYRIIGYLGFVCCSLLIYWSGLDNLIYLSITLAFILFGCALIDKTESFWRTIISNLYLVIYLLSLTLVSYLRSKNIIDFPTDNCLVCLIGLIGCYVFTQSSLNSSTIHANLDKIQLEISSQDKDN